MPDDSYLVSDVVQAIEYGAEAADLDELGALLLLFGAPDAPARGGGGGGCDGGDPEGVLGGGGGGIVVVVTAKVIDVDVGSREPDCDNVRSIVGVVIRGTEEVVLVELEGSLEITGSSNGSLRSKGRRVRKICKPMSSLKLVDEHSVEDVSVEEPAYNEEEANLQRALELSLKEQPERTQRPACPVVIRELDSGRIQPLPETLKNKSHMDQFIFQRRTPMPAEASGPAESPSLDAELALTDSETEFDDEDGREIFGMPIPDALITDEIKGVTYYGEYQEHVAKYQQNLDAEHGKATEEGATESSKATKVTKPKAAKATKPASDPKPKLAPTQPPKAVP
nr:hypothetical protein [Tanacetum cinerariifolium]